MAVARLTHPSYVGGTTGALVPELHRPYAYRDWDPTGRHYRLRDGSLGTQNNVNYTGSGARSKYLAYALPREGTRISLDAGLNYNTSGLPGFK